jgi:hypothetical protein
MPVMPAPVAAGLMLADAVALPFALPVYIAIATPIIKAVLTSGNGLTGALVITTPPPVVAMEIGLMSGALGPPDPSHLSTVSLIFAELAKVGTVTLPAGTIAMAKDKKQLATEIATACGGMAALPYYESVVKRVVGAIELGLVNPGTGQVT